MFGQTVGSEWKFVARVLLILRAAMASDKKEDAIISRTWRGGVSLPHAAAFAGAVTCTVAALRLPRCDTGACARVLAA